MSDCLARARISIGLLGLALVLAAPAWGLGARPTQSQNDPPDRVGGDPVAPGEQAESEDQAAEPADDEQTEVASDAMRDQVLEKFIRRRILIDKPRFSLETGGKIQVQYFDADPDDPNHEDEWLLRRVRPFLLGHFAKSWRWKFELEVSSQVSAGTFNSNDLDVRDAFVRYEGFEREGTRLTLGNQKVPFSREFMGSSTHQPFVERSFAGSTKAGVPDRIPGVHFRSPSRSGKLVLWASAGTAVHRQDTRGIPFESAVRAGSDLNHGWLAAARLDLRPTGALHIGKDIHYDLSLATYHWSNDGSSNPLTQEGESLDPEKADLDQASGVELSGALKAGRFTLLAQYNRIRADTVVEGFTGGVYLDGETDLEVALVEAGYRIPGSWVHLTGGLSRVDSKGYATPWKEQVVGLNLNPKRYLAKLQISHRWIFDRFGVPNEDFRETRIQVQYVW
jgi:phosphate-selective porin OprO/OprP